MDAPIIDKPRGTVVERVLRRLPEEFTDLCYEWPGKRTASGYGTIREGGRDTRANIRVTAIVFEHFNGAIPQDHRVVMHTCDNPPCVNPRHLISGTDGDNMRDKMLKGRAGKTLTPDDVRNIRSDPRGSTTVGREYGVSKTIIQAIRNRRVWTWVD